MDELCRHCGGVGIRKREPVIEVCEWCGGYGTTSWIGNITGTSEREPINEVVRKVVEPFGWEVKDKTTVQKVNAALEEALKDTNLIIEIESFSEMGFNLKGRRRNGELEKQT